MTDKENGRFADATASGAEVSNIAVGSTRNSLNMALLVCSDEMLPTLESSSIRRLGALT
jgi:hypothetical protein